MFSLRVVAAAFSQNSLQQVHTKHQRAFNFGYSIGANSIDDLRCRRRRYSFFDFGFAERATGFCEHLRVMAVNDGTCVWNLIST